MSKFIKGDDGNWYWSSTGYALGTEVDSSGVSFYQHLLDDGSLTLVEIIDQVMLNVNDALADGEKTNEKTK